MLDFLLRRPPDITGFVLVAIVLIIALSLHEFGHAAATTWQGDPTAKLAGRLTLNPLSHLDPFGSLMIVLVGFGWGKPVPFSPNRLRNQRYGPALVALAGPAMNVFLAFAFAFALRPFVIVDLSSGSRLNEILVQFLLIGVYSNVTLAIFNLLPIPPLDGSRLLTVFLPPSQHRIIFWLDRWGALVLLIVAFLLFRPVVSPLIRRATDLILRLVM